MSATGAAGYGYTEALTDADGAHHRLGGSAAVGYVPATWLQLAGRLDGRIDLHDGSDTSAVGEPALLARVGHDLTDAFAAGLEVLVRFPGADAPSYEPAATTPELRMLATASPSSDLRLGAYAGYRLDRSAESVDRPDLLSLGDRASLGASDFDAVLLGAGLALALGPGEALGEVTYDLLVGEGAPTSASPLRVLAGYRVPLGALQVGGVADVLVTGRPEVGPVDPLVPIDPRFSVRAVLSYAFSGAPEEAAKPPPTPPEEQVEAAKPPTPAPAVPGSLRVVVTAPDGSPVPDAVVLFEGASGEQTLVFANGAYELAQIPKGTGKLSVVADGYESVERSVAIEAGKAVDASVVLEPALPQGQIRGLVRSFSGEPIQAQIVVSGAGGGAPQKLAADASGNFSVDVQPGQYRVEIGAPGYQPQKRQVTVKEKGVVILNADLQKGK